MTNIYDTRDQPLGSTSAKVLANNASNEDLFVNDRVNEFFVDRPPFTRNRYTIFGMEQAFNRFLEGSGNESVHLTYVDGSPLQVDRPSQLIDRDGSIYRIRMPASFPVMLTGDWAVDAPFLVETSDAALQQLLATPGGSAMVGVQRFPSSQVSTVEKVLKRNSPANVLDYMTEVEVSDVLSLSPVLDHTVAFQQALNNNATLEVPPLSYNITDLVCNKMGHSVICLTSSGGQAYGGGAVFRGTDGSKAMVTVTKPTSYFKGLVFVGTSDDLEKGSNTSQVGIRFLGDAQKDVDAKVSNCGFLYLNTDVEMNGTNIEFESTIFSNSTFGFSTSVAGGWENRGVIFSDTCRFHSMGKAGTTTAAVNLIPGHNIRDVMVAGVFDDCVTAVSGFASGTSIDALVVRARGTGLDLNAAGHGHPAYIRSINVSLDYYANAATNAAMANSGVITQGLMRLTMDNVTVHGSGGHGVDQRVTGAVMRGVHASDAGQFADDTYDGVNISGAGCFVNGVSGSQDAQGTPLPNKARHSIFLGGTSTYVGSISPGLNTRSGPLGVSPTAQIYGNLPSFTGPTPSITWGPAVPTTGTFARGSVRWNTAPSPGGVAGWTCTTAGAPGTWRSFGTVAT